MAKKQSIKLISYQGNPGAYSDLACRAAFPKLTRVPCANFTEVFEALMRGRADLAMIPIDNSIAGRVADIHYLLPKYDVHFVGEHFLPIDHCLLGIKGATLGDIKKVYSHAHALPQCRKIIRAHKWEQAVAGDTAGAALAVAAMSTKACAAIASAAAAKIYGLKVLKKNIADENNNVTRFLALGRKPMTPKRKQGGAYITGFIFNVGNIPAALYKSLGGFASNGINMIKLESYMPGGGFLSTGFFCEVGAHIDDPALKNAIEEMKFFATDVRILGTYEASPFRSRK